MTTLNDISSFYELKNAERPSAAALQAAATYRAAAERVAAGKDPQSKAAKELVAARAGGIRPSGNPVDDWKLA